MILNFIHFEHPETALFICLDKIAYTQQVGEVIFIYFDGIPKPVTLAGGAAQVFIQIIKDNSLTVYSAALDNKNAESLAKQESSE
jgi:hypothetical protein